MSHKVLLIFSSVFLLAGHFLGFPRNRLTTNRINFNWNSINSKILSLFNSKENDFNTNSDDHLNGLWKRVDVPSPLHLIVDFNIERNSVVYEVSLGREIGLEIVPDRNGLAVVGQVFLFS